MLMKGIILDVKYKTRIEILVSQVESKGWGGAGKVRKVKVSLD